MGKVDCCSLEGYELLFHSEDHGPPHIHVRRPHEWDIRVSLLLTTEKHLDYVVKWPRTFIGPARKVRRQICALVTEHRDALLEEWDEKVNAD